jgi:hypothetical protein
VTTPTPRPAEVPAQQQGSRLHAAPLRQTRSQLALRVAGALALLTVGAVHLEQYFAVHYRVVPTIGTLFLLNFIGATAIGLLLLPIERLLGRAIAVLLALGAIAIAAVSFAFLFVSEETILFGFREYGYRTAIIISLVAEGVTALLLGAWLASYTSRR